MREKKAKAAMEKRKLELEQSRGNSGTDRELTGGAGYDWRAQWGFAEPEEELDQETDTAAAAGAAAIATSSGAILAPVSAQNQRQG